MTDLYLCDISDFDFSLSGKLLPYLPLKKRFEVEQMADTECERKLAPLADLYVCDAFAASHRAQPTLCG